MDNKTILSKISEIENEAYNFRHLKEIADTTYDMSNISNITTMQIFVKGLASELNAMSAKLLSVWNHLYTLEQKLEKELTEQEPTIDEEPEVTENDLPFC